MNGPRLPPRSSGVQLHITSLPGGRLGPEAYRFVDWLAAAGQSWWQVLPLGPPDRYRSPYKSRSAFAAWPGLLSDRKAAVSAAEVSDFRESCGYWIEDWERFAGRGAVLDQVRFDREWGALRRYCADRGVRLLGDLPIYVAPRSADHAAHPELFQDGLVAGAPPDAFSAAGQLWGNPLYDWPANRRQGYRWWVERLRRTLSLFDYARIDHFRGFVAYWAVPAGACTAAVGRWKRGPGRAVFDAIARGLGGGGRDAIAGGLGGGGRDAIARGLGGGGRDAIAGGLGGGGRDAIAGGLGGGGRDAIARGLGGGGRDAIAGGLGGGGRDAIARGLGGGGSLALVAEDLGVITPAVEALRDELGLPGMCVLQFGFDPDHPESVHRPTNHAEWRFVYTGTHDHDTARGWYSSLDPSVRVMVDGDLARFSEREPWWGLIRLAFSSPARVAMIQAQDVLGLGSEGRMNDPRRATGNWRWQMEAGALTASLAARLREATEEAGRLAG